MPFEFPYRGKGAFMNNLTLMPLNVWVAKCKAIGISWVAIKVDKWEHNSLYVNAGKAFRDAGIGVTAWQFIYDDDPAGRAQVGVRDTLALGATAFFMDAEGPYNKIGTIDDIKAKAYTAVLVPALHAKGIAIGLCSYRFPSMQPNFAWAPFLAVSDFHSPQVYWVGAHNPAYQLKASIKELLAKKSIPVIPAGAAYSEKVKINGISTVFRTAPAETAEFIDTAQSSGCQAMLLWVADEMFSEKWWEFKGSTLALRQAWCQVVKEHIWDGVPLPPPEPPPVGALYPATCAVGAANVRSGPGTTYSVVGLLRQYDKVWVFQESPGWLRIGDNKWVSKTLLTREV